MDTLADQYGHDESIFLSEVPDYLHCVVCSLVLRDPVMILQCGHKFCEVCFQRIKDYSSANNTDITCPVDRDVIDVADVRADVGMRRIVGNLTVKCWEHENGCTWTGDLRDMKKHHDGCEHRQVKEVSVCSEDRLRDICHLLDQHDVALKDKDKQVASLKCTLEEQNENQEQQHRRLQQLSEQQVQFKQHQEQQQERLQVQSKQHMQLEQLVKKQQEHSKHQQQQLQEQSRQQKQHQQQLKQLQQRSKQQQDQLHQHSKQQEQQQQSKVQERQQLVQQQQLLDQHHLQQQQLQQLFEKQQEQLSQQQKSIEEQQEHQELQLGAQLQEHLKQQFKQQQQQLQQQFQEHQRQSKQLQQQQLKQQQQQHSNHLQQLQQHLKQQQQQFQKEPLRQQQLQYKEQVNQLQQQYEKFKDQQFKDQQRQLSEQQKLREQLQQQQQKQEELVLQLQQIRENNQLHQNETNELLMPLINKIKKQLEQSKQIDGGVPTIRDVDVSSSVEKISLDSSSDTAVRSEQSTESKRIVLQHHSGDPSYLKISQDSHSIQFSDNRWSIISAPTAVVPTGKKAWYEVKWTFPKSFNHGATCAIGWGTPDLSTLRTYAYKGVGQDAEGYGYHPFSGRKRHNGEELEWGLPMYRRSGVVGVALDMMKGEMLFSLDGKWDSPMGVAFSGIDTSRELFPAMSANFATFEFNFGDRDFIFGPPDDTFQKLLDIL